MEGLQGIAGGLRTQAIVDQQRAVQTKEIQHRAKSDLDTAADELEVLFSTMLVKEMRGSLSEGLFGKGPGVDTFEGWFDDHLGRSLADGGALELSGLVKTAMGGSQMPVSESGASA